MALNREQSDALVGVVFGTIVRHIREQRNQTLTPFAALLGMQPDELRWIEDGTDASVTALYHMAEALGVSCARIAAAMQIVVNDLLRNPATLPALKQKDWSSITKMTTHSIQNNLDLLKLPSGRSQITLEEAVKPIPKVTGVLAASPPPLTPIANYPGDDDEPDPIDDDDEDLAEDDESLDEVNEPVPPPAQPRSPRKVASPDVEVEVKPSNQNGSGVQRRGPGRPRKYPVPPTA